MLGHSPGYLGTHVDSSWTLLPYYVHVSYQSLVWKQSEKLIIVAEAMIGGIYFLAMSNLDDDYGNEKNICEPGKQSWP